MTLTFIGHGYVGLVTAAVFADLGNKVWVIGHTPSKIEGLKKGVIPIYEPGLEELVKKNISAGRLHFTLDFTPAIPESDVVFIAVGTPTKENGESDLSVVFDVAENAGKHLDGYTVVITKSTVPVGTNKKVKEIIEKVKPAKAEFDVASVPEFLREGQAISDTFRPDRVVIGTQSKRAEDILVELHRPVSEDPVLTTIETAEMIKYASNAFLATKISFAHAIAFLSEKVGADGVQVLDAMGLDNRIGRAFLAPGVGYGGSCFPKDVKALITIAQKNGYNFSLLKEVEEVNKQAKENISKKVESFFHNGIKGKRVGILGLAFKPDTDDMREASSLVIIRDLLKSGAKIKVYDPVAMSNAKTILKEHDIEYADDAYSAVEGADVVVVVTEWNEFKELDLQKFKKLMKTHNMVDGRNIYDPKKARSLGFNYIGVGR